MRIVRFHLDPEPLTMHPRLTVWAGLAPDTRVAMLDAARRVCRGEPPTGAALLEAHGLLLDADRSTFAMLELDEGVDPVLSADDLVVDRELLEQAIREANATPLDRAEAATAAAEAAVESAKAALYSVTRESDRHRQYIEQLENEIRRLGDIADQPAQDQLAAVLHAVTDMELKLRVRTGALAAFDIERTKNRLQRLGVIAAALAGGNRTDVGSVQMALDVAKERAFAGPRPDPAAHALADRLETLHAELARCEGAFRYEGVGLAELSDRVEQSQRRVAEARSRLHEVSHDPTVVAALEQAHERVLALERRASSKLRGRGVEQELDQAKAAERALLDELGQPSWMDYLLDVSTTTGRTPEQADLKKAEAEQASAEAAWAGLIEQMEADPRMGQLLGELDQASTQAVALVGEVDDPVAALRRLQVAPASPEVRDAAITALRRALADAGAHGFDQVADVELAQAADAWIAAEMASNANPAIQAAEQHLHRELARLDWLASAFAGGGVRPTDQPAAMTLLQHLTAAEDAFDQTAAALSPVVQRARELEHRRAAMAATDKRIADAQAQLGQSSEYLNRVRDERDRLLRAAAPTARAAHGQSSQPDAVDVGDEVVRQVADKVSQLRDRGFVGSLPVFIDRAFDALDSDVLFSVLTAVKNLSAAVQVVLLTDNTEIVDWAAILTPEQARCSVVGVGVDV